MDKKIKIKLFKWGLSFLAILIIGMMPFILKNPVFAQGQETCPASGDWVKQDGLSGTSFTFTAPEGKLIAETCYKASTEVIFNIINPPKKSVTVISTVGHDLSHASFRLVDEPEPSPTPTDEPTPSPTPTDEPTPNPTPTDEPTPSPTPTDEPGFVTLSLSGLCSGSVASIGVFQATEETITWTVSNENDVAVSFNWSANNGQSGSGTVPANGNTMFVTNIDGYSVALEYTLGDQEISEQASIEPCEPQQETEEPTSTSTPTEDPTDEPEASQDPEPDQPAGGSGPSIVLMLLPVLLTLTTVGSVSAILLKNKKETIS